jgi:predicted ABC-type ATPase
MRDQLAWERTNEARSAALENGLTFIWETVFSHKSRLEEMRRARYLGYCVILIYVSTKHPDINAERVKARVRANGHNVPEEKIRERYARSVGMLPEMLELSDIAFVCDNSADVPKLIFTKMNNVYRETRIEGLDAEVSGWLNRNVLLPLWELKKRTCVL